MFVCTTILKSLVSGEAMNNFRIDKSKFGLCENLIENKYLSGPDGRQRKYRKVDISEFGLTILLLYINSARARKISAEILYRFFILKSYIEGLSENQIGALKGYYRNRMND